MSWLDRFPLGWLVALAVWMAVAPITPEPHLIEKTPHAVCRHADPSAGYL